MAKEPNRAAEMAVFVRVVEAGDFSGAARALGLSPSAVSKLVSRLEARLGTRLLRRSTRRLALTAEGEAFHARAVAILAEIDAAEREAGGARLPAGRVRIRSSASYVTHVLAPLLAGFLNVIPISRSTSCRAMRSAIWSPIARILPSGRGRWRVPG